MASVPSAGCLLAKNQYYRRESISWYCSLLSNSCLSPCLSFSQCLTVWASLPLAGLPEFIDKHWWIKGFFHSEPSLPAAGRKTLSAS
ncbi:PDPFL protein, partial [Upupa epops]|nr:PDPFL protein [Upupa epops]